jgi:hypothetical protein
VPTVATVDASKHAMPLVAAAGWPTIAAVDQISGNTTLSETLLSGRKFFHWS